MLRTQGQFTKVHKICTNPEVCRPLLFESFFQFFNAILQPSHSQEDTKRAAAVIGKSRS